MKLILKTSLFLLFYLLLSGCSGPINIDSVEIKDELFFKDGERFSGELYSKSKKGFFGDIGTILTGDSIIYVIDDGFCNKIKCFKENSLVLEINQEPIQDKIRRTTSFYTKTNSGGNEVRYQTSSIDGKLEGETIEWAFDGEGILGSNERYIKTVQNFKNNEKDGETINYYRNGDKKEVLNFKNGQLSGKSKGWYPNGNLEYEKLYNNNSLVEEKNYYRKANVLKNKKIYSNFKVQEEYKWSFNEVLFYQKKGDQMDSLILDGYYEFIDNEKETHVNYVKGKKEGKVEIFYPNGKKWEELIYENGIRNGVHKKWYLNGELALEVNYLKGKKHGTEKKMYDSGDKWHVIEYKNGLKSGTSNSWYKNGQLAKTETFSNGVNQGTSTEYYQSGKKWKEIKYSQVSKGTAGLYQSWFKDGAKAEEYELLNGKKHGYYKKWWGNGKLRLQVDYVEGLKNGAYKNWLEDGTLYSERMYIKDKEQ
ncbi:toxin-antitoxin system YwqK family antitoxin [Brumimicrobium aurantiacum]|uniref:Toxin-antitoxin system YwqK family antitoxin n=1 Tax=Brumimicrobium aurantiacum TaxID=1737063 RepID=A0A3E1EYS7_9FLAO|nr:toxin-antitoxin system YwqK family antitoxin [Brumimicrobium aurantiacum]RFC54715.1 toxin-antitoxin system YwqK family antitoxin [Brumimicrobium aurantiacum]